jgi:serum/glucocorticoid-regulated kinase 2
MYSLVGRGLALSQGIQIPDAIKSAVESALPARRSTSNRESVQRRRYWWLPYVVLEFDKNEVLIDALGGDLANPVWNYRADLCVLPLSHLAPLLTVILAPK